MQRPALFVILAAALSLTAASADAAHHRRRHAALTCPPRHSRLIAMDSQAVVYEGFDSAGALRIYGCTYQHKHPYLLGERETNSEGFSSGIGREALGGTIVAYEEHSVGEKQIGCEKRCFERSPSWEVTVKDLRDGVVLHKYPTGTIFSQQCPELLTESIGFVLRQECTGLPTPALWGRHFGGGSGIGPTMALVVTSRGAVAWTVRNSEVQCLPPRFACYVIWGFWTTGNGFTSERPGVDPSSLALGGDTVYWLIDGKPHWVTLE